MKSLSFFLSLSMSMLLATSNIHLLANYKKGEKKMLRVAINGFGRIGRNFLRGFLYDENARKHMKIVAINIGPAQKENTAHMFMYDTLLGTFHERAYFENDHLVIGDYRIKIIAECNPAQIGWDQLNIDWVVECTGCFTHREGAQKHIAAGAKHVLISAPAKGEDVSIIPGLNLDAFDTNQHKIVSLGSCTTNAFLPMLRVLHDLCGIKCGFMTTIHAYTNAQALLDVERKDLRRSRAAALNIIPTSTGAANMIPKIMPELGGCISAISVRVPVGKVSFIDFAFESHKQTTIEQVNEAFYNASRGNLHGIMDITMEPLVSSDFSCNNHSVIIDGQLTQVNGNMVKVFGWYDNEWGYSLRLKDFLMYVAQS